MKVGFAKSDISDICREEVMQVHDHLHARVMAICDSDVAGVIAVLDLVGISKLAVDVIRESVAHVFSIPVQSVVVSVTHTHSSPPEYQMDIAKLSAGVIRAAQEAACSAREAEIALVKTDVGRKFSRNRRWDSKSDLGTFTIIDNDRCTFRNDEVYVREYVEHFLKDDLKLSDVPAFPDDARLDGAVDGRTCLLHVVDGNGKTLGGIAWFTAHVDQIALRHGNILSAEYPGYLCEYLEHALGGCFMFLNGPCGDMKPYYQGYNWDECRRIGERLAESVTLLLKKCSYVPLESFGLANEVIVLDSRDDFVKDMAALEDEQRELNAERFAGRLGSYPLPEAKKRNEHRWLVDWLVYCARHYPENGRWVFLRERPYEIGLLSLNNEPCYLFMQDEVFSEIAFRLRKQFPQFKNLMPVAYSNGAESYLMPSAEFDKGGYEVTATIHGRDSFNKVHAAAVNMLKEIE